jgi:hypothetical protein
MHTKSPNFYPKAGALDSANNQIHKREDDRTSKHIPDWAKPEINKINVNQFTFGGRNPPDEFLNDPLNS